MSKEKTTESDPKDAYGSTIEVPKKFNGVNPFEPVGDIRPGTDYAIGCGPEAVGADMQNAGLAAVGFKPVPKGSDVGFLGIRVNDGQQIAMYRDRSVTEHVRADEIAAARAQNKSQRREDKKKFDDIVGDMADRVRSSRRGFAQVSVDLD